jgi:hypothetical protein
MLRRQPEMSEEEGRPDRSPEAVPGALCDVDGWPARLAEQVAAAARRRAGRAEQRRQFAAARAASLRARHARKMRSLE